MGCIGLILFVLAILHVIWAAVIRFSHGGEIVSGDFREPDDPESNYLIAHGLFLMIYVIATVGVLALSCLSCGCCVCYLCCIFKAAEHDTN